MSELGGERIDIKQGHLIVWVATLDRSAQNTGTGVRLVLALGGTPLTRDIALTVSDFAFAMSVQNLAWGFLQPVAGALAVFPGPPGPPARGSPARCPRPRACASSAASSGRACGSR